MGREVDEWSNLEQGEVVDAVMVIVGVASMGLMWAFAKGLEKL